VSFLSFDSYPLWLNTLIFLFSAGTIWSAGVRLERNADAIAKRTGLGTAFTGMLGIAAATSLPEVATTITAVALLNNPTLAVYNLVGGVALQTGILAVADRANGDRGPLTYFNPRFVLLIEGVGLILLLQLTIAGVTTRGLPSIASVSVGSVLIFLTYIAVMYLTYRSQGHPRWTPSAADDVPQEGNTEIKMNPVTKRNFAVFPVLDWIAALTVHIPNKGEQLVRYYGYYSNVSRGKRKAMRALRNQSQDWLQVYRPLPASGTPGSRRIFAQASQLPQPHARVY
jgi:Ca2+/Na+ antiporter